MSIKENALIVSVNVELPTKARTDKNAIDEVAKKFGVSPRSLDIRKSLYPKHLMEPIDSVVYKARQYAQRDTYMWARGEFLLPVDFYMEFAEGGGKIELEFQQAVTAFLNNWSNVLLGAEKELAGLYEAGLYPSLEELRKQFSLKFKYRQVTDENDFRVSLQAEELEDLRSRTEVDTLDRMAGLQRAPLQHLKKTLDTLATKLAAPMREIKDDNGTVIELRPAIFRNSTVDNITDECRKIISFGATVIGQAAIGLANKILDELPDADTIRGREEVRNVAKQQAVDFSNSIDQLLQVMGAPAPAAVETEAVNPMGLNLEVTAEPTLSSEPEVEPEAEPVSVPAPVVDTTASIELPPVTATVVPANPFIAALEDEINDMFG